MLNQVAPEYRINNIAAAQQYNEMMNLLEFSMQIDYIHPENCIIDCFEDPEVFFYGKEDQFHYAVNDEGQTPLNDCELWNTTNDTTY